MEAKRLRKLKWWRAAAETTAKALEGGHKISTQYVGAAEVDPLNYVLLSIRGKVREYKNRGVGGSADGGGGGGRAISDQRNNMTMFMIHGKLTARREELEGKKAA